MRKRWEFNKDNWIERDSTGTTWYGEFAHIVKYEIAKSFREEDIRPDTHNVDKVLDIYLDKTLELFQQEMYCKVVDGRIERVNG
jgi:hypothetical protein